MLNWKPISNKSYENYVRVLVFDPHAELEAMRVRVIPSNVIRCLPTLTQWAKFEEPEDYDIDMAFHDINEILGAYNHEVQ